MKYCIVVVIATLMMWTSCSTQQKIEYDFPPAMAAHIQSEYLKLCEQGRVLYLKHCAACHSTKKGGKLTIPNFTEEEMVGYGIRVSNKRHEESMPDSLVTEEELGMISTFFAYKKKQQL